MAFEKIQVAKGDTGYLLSGDVHAMLHAHPARRRMWHCDRHLTTGKTSPGHQKLIINRGSTNKPTKPMVIT